MGGRVGRGVVDSSHATDRCCQSYTHDQPRIRAHQAHGESRRVKAFGDGGGDEEASASVGEGLVETRNCSESQ